MIPKIVHYCWFGNTPKNYLANRYVKSFNKLGGGVKIIEWNEQNCDLDENNYIR
ncbi:glycosyl transferase, partial [Bacteroides sp. An51A]